MVLVGLEPEDEAGTIFLRLRKASGPAPDVLTVAPYSSRGLTKMAGRLLPAAPGAEAQALADLPADVPLDSSSVILVGERLATSPGALSAAADLAARTGAALAWVPRRAGDRGAVETGCLPTLLPGGRPVADPAARVDVATAWGVDQLPADAGRDADAIVAAVAQGDPRRAGRGRRRPRRHRGPRRLPGGARRAGFVVALELRETDVTRAADVVFPVAPVTDKAGTFVTWEGRLRPFEEVFGHNPASLPDLRVLAGIAEELDRPLGFRTVAEVRREWEQLGPWDGERAAAVPASGAARARPGSFALASWKQLVDLGSMQDGEEHLRATGRAAVARVGPAAYADLGADRVTLTGDRGSLTLPAEVADDMVDATVWVPANSVGNGVLADLASPGSRVTVKGARSVSALSISAAGMLSLGLPTEAADLSAFGQDNVWVIILKTVLIFLVLVLLTLFNIWLERRVVARMQHRIGPNVHGPFGLLQSLADGVKLALKEDIIPKAADKVVFVLAPVIAVVPAFVTFAVIPFGPEVTIPFTDTVTPLQLTDMPVAVLFVMAIASVGIYGIVLGGWSSGSTYSLLGGLRSSAQMISYEVAMGLAFVAVFLYSGSMSTSQIVAPQNDGYFWFGLMLAPSFIIYMIAMVGETNRAPFDLPEAEGELVGGFHTEYSSLKFALFFLAEYINMATVSAVATTLFLGGWHAPWRIINVWAGADQGYWPLLWFFGKVFFFVFIFIWLRGTLPRLRYDQFMHFGWKRLIPISLVWILAVATIELVKNNGGFDTAAPC